MTLLIKSRFLLLVGLLALVGCSSSSDKTADAPKKASGAAKKQAAANSADSNTSTNQTPSKSTTKSQRTAAEQKALDEIRKLYGKVEFADARPTAPVVKVSFKSQRRVKGTDLGILAPLTTIQELDIDGTSVTDISLLAPLTKLKVLYLPDMAPDQFESLAKLPSLESLSVGVAKPSLASAGIDNPFKNRTATKDFNSQDFVGKSLTSLSGSRTLKHLRITQGGSATQGGGWLRAETFAPLQSFPGLTFLEFQPFISATSEKEELEAAAFQHISRCRTLNTLVVTKQLSLECMTSLAESRSLKHLQAALPPRNGDAIVRKAATMPTLERFNVRNGMVSDTLLIQLKRENPRFVVEQKKRDLWNELVVGNR